MPEYIERETAVAWFMPYAHAEESIDADVVISDIKGMKAADVDKVRHGRWAIDEFGHYCTACREYGPEIECDEETVDLLKYGTPYCPNCGAKMDIEGSGGAVFK